MSCPALFDRNNGGDGAATALGDTSAGWGRRRRGWRAHRRAMLTDSRATVHGRPLSHGKHAQRFVRQFYEFDGNKRGSLEEDDLIEAIAAQRAEKTQSRGRTSIRVLWAIAEPQRDSRPENTVY